MYKGQFISQQGVRSLLAYHELILLNGK